MNTICNHFTAPQIAEIKSAVAHHYGLTVADLVGPARDRKYSRPRQVAMFLCRDMTTRSIGEIGRAFCRDHTTVLHGVKAVSMSDDPEIMTALERIRLDLSGFESRRWVVAIPFKSRRAA